MRHTSAYCKRERGDGLEQVATGSDARRDGSVLQAMYREALTELRKSVLAAALKPSPRAPIGSNARRAAEADR